MTPEELLAEVLKVRSFIARGGVTLTGGEPLLQADFCREFFVSAVRKVFIRHWTLQEPCSMERVCAVLDYTNLVLLDIKALRLNLQESQRK